MGFRLAESCLSPQIENDGIISGDLETNPPESPRKTLSKSVEYDSTAVRQHPLGIKPSGNAYTAKENIKVAAGLFATLPDELVVQVLEWFDAVALQQIECTCKVLYAFSRLEDLWRTLLVK